MDYAVVHGGNFAADTSTVTDEALNARTNTTDALGRLIQVVEAPGVANYGYTTTYVYDPIDTLNSVNQGGQSRTFQYTSLGRLNSAANPETGGTGAPVQYTYDP